MTDAPERIWATGDKRNGSWTHEPVPEKWGAGATEYVRADVSRAAVEAAYIAGLDAAEKVAEHYDEHLSNGAPKVIRALKDPALVRAAVAKLTETAQEPTQEGDG